MKAKLDVKKCKEVISKTSKYIKEEDKDLRHNRKYLGTGGLNNFIQYNSSPRGYMMSSHLSQTLTLNNPDSKIIKSGVEDELAKSIILVKAKSNYEVISVIKRYTDGITYTDIGKTIEYTIIARDIDNDLIDVIVVPYLCKFHPYFGHKYNRDEDYLNSITYGDTIPKGTVLAWPPTYDPVTDEYGFGKNLNVAFMTIDDDDEDGFVISESAAKSLSFKMFETRTINVGRNSFLLNIYGDDDNYKSFPDIGEPINDSCVVAVKREYDTDLSPALYSINDTKQFNPIFDTAYHVKKSGGRVADIKVVKSPHKKIMLPKDTDKSLDRYSDALIKYYTSIINTYNNIVSKNEIYRPAFSDELNTLIQEAYVIVESNKPNSGIKKMYRKEELDIYKIDIDVEYDIEPTIGYKITGLAGDK